MKPLFRCKRAVGTTTTRLVALLAANLMFVGSAVSAVDPTRPAVLGAVKSSQTQVPQNGGMVLQSIFKKSKKLTAIISGEFYSEGDAIGEYVISKINRRDVELANGRQRKTLRLYSYELKK
ncbi:agglutinin biogenesis protein MshK [Alteromonas sp. 1_MG-2023]|uniref:agglutinin biogenesis protein MshK n=1 Tax=Alteromonas sp. 1_MG-2023 TaxID=3062669 RepID=UPI0026E36A0B|nr:agglutinin biogenesis protein MshK [Alteromonas sp. 1_MG-2023]MDO6566687.1 agglutinin biogenesis protein MshK [Alteromonas sp. 1_MG-2023]